MARVLVGYDGSPPARRALDHATKRAIASGDELVLITIIPEQVRDSSLSAMMPAGLTLPPEMGGTFEETATRRLDAMVKDLTELGAKARAEVRTGDTADEFLRAAEELSVQEIVIGHKAFEGPHLKLGPNAEKIMALSKVPVTLV